MKNKRKNLIPRGMGSRVRFIRILLFLVIVIALVNAAISLQLLNTHEMLFGIAVWHFVLQFTFVVFGVVLITTLAYILHYGFGAIFRIEKILDQIVKGERSLRINLRKNDFLRPIAEKVNLVLEQLEAEKKKP